MQDLVTFVKYAPNNENKYMLVVQLDQKLTCLRKLIRFANNKNNYNNVNIPLGTHSYEVWSNFNKEIGLMINGLIMHITRDLKVKSIIFNKSQLQKNPYINPNLRNPNPAINMNDVEDVYKYVSELIEKNNKEELEEIRKEYTSNIIEGIDINTNTNINKNNSSSIPPIPNVPDFVNMNNSNINNNYKSLDEIQQELNKLIDDGNFTSTKSNSNTTNTVKVLEDDILPKLVKPTKEFYEELKRKKKKRI